MRTTKHQSLARGRPRPTLARLTPPPGHLRRLRRLADMTAPELAERIQARGWKVSESSILSWEQGRRAPPAAVAGALARALGVRVADLTSEGDDP